MKINRTPLLYIVLGFLGGVIIARNTAPMAHPEQGAAFLAGIVGGFVLWRAGYKGKSMAVAQAVSIAVANATSIADAKAQAVAQQAVQVVLNQRGNITPMSELYEIEYAEDSEYDHSTEQLDPVRMPHLLPRSEPRPAVSPRRARTPAKRTGDEVLHVR